LTGQLEERDRRLEERDRRLEERDRRLEERGRRLEERGRRLEKRGRRLEKLDWRRPAGVRGERRSRERRCAAVGQPTFSQLT
jgi:uncharacterized protein (DUF3084 family)